MSEYVEEFRELFETIKGMGFIRTNRKGPTGIGKTFEDLLLKEEDNLPLPDFKDIEVKTKRTASNSMVTLFTKSPTGPRGANGLLKNKYGYKEDPDALFNKLHTTLSAVKFTTNKKSGYDFKIGINEEEGYIYVIVKDSITDEVVDISTRWTFQVLDKTLNNKLKYLCIVDADERKNEGFTEFKYTKLNFIYDLSWPQMLQALKDGKLFVDLRIGTNPNGSTHDHGTGFRMKVADIELYGNKQVFD